jgi:hypothetical protein
MTQRHSMLRRQALLVRSGLEPLTDADRARLQASIFQWRFLEGASHTFCIS